jgi:hypothetical protein
VEFRVGPMLGSVIVLQTAPQENPQEMESPRGCTFTVVNGQEHTSLCAQPTQHELFLHIIPLILSQIALYVKPRSAASESCGQTPLKSA